MLMFIIDVNITVALVQVCAVSVFPEIFCNFALTNKINSQIITRVKCTHWKCCLSTINHNSFTCIESILCIIVVIIPHKKSVKNTQIILWCSVSLFTKHNQMFHSCTIPVTSKLYYSSRSKQYCTVKLLEVQLLESIIQYSCRLLLRKHNSTCLPFNCSITFTNK